MLLKDLLNNVPCVEEVRGSADVQIEVLSTDSRDSVRNGLFFCISGLRFDAHAFAAQAEKNGNVAFLVERFVNDVEATQVLVRNVRSAMAYIASAFFGHPERELRMAGICGTKGKTTTSYLLKAITEKAGIKTGLIGTTGNMIGETHLPSNMTTPDPIDLHRCLRKMADSGVDVVSMEVSAHAIAMHRLDGIPFATACYTNLSQDHLDYFGSMEAYFECKKSFFTSGVVQKSAVNADDEHGEIVLRDCASPCTTYGISAEADVYARDIEISENGVSFVIYMPNQVSFPVSMHLTGMFNVYNALAAASAAMHLGIAPQYIREGLESIRNVPGRVEVLDTHTPYKVILDYAHSPDALRNVLSTVRAFTRNRLIALVGCGGDRDHGKRPMMGEIVGHLADYSILTSDNPRTEDPFEILRAIESGIKRTSGKYTVIENRREAIRHALEIGGEGDVIILAGKGNETYQDIMGVKRPFDEKVIVHELLEEMKQTSSEE